MYQGYEDAWNHRHYYIFNQEQTEEVRRINFECFEQLNTAIIRAFPEFIQHNYTDEIMFEDLQPDLNLFERIRGPIWIDYPTESDIQVSILLQFIIQSIFLFSSSMTR